MRSSGFKSGYFFKGYVVFENNISLWWLRFLKKGYRHCYVLICLSEKYNSWLELNPMSNQLYVFKHESLLGLDYLNHLKTTKNAVVVPVEFCQAPLKCAPLGFFTCVEFVKRILGIHKVSIVTPYQLYTFLTNSQK